MYSRLCHILWNCWKLSAYRFYGPFEFCFLFGHGINTSPWDMKCISSARIFGSFVDQMLYQLPLPNCSSLPLLLHRFCHLNFMVWTCSRLATVRRLGLWITRVQIFNKWKILASASALVIRPALCPGWAIGTQGSRPIKQILGGQKHDRCNKRSN